MEDKKTRAINDMWRNLPPGEIEVWHGGELVIIAENSFKAYCFIQDNAETSVLSACAEHGWRVAAKA